MNDSIEEQLRNALTRREPSEDFSSRVITALDKGKPSGRRLWYALLAAVVALLFVFTGVDQNKRQKQMRARETERQVVFALTLTMEKLNQINGRVQESAPELQVQDKGRR